MRMIQYSMPLRNGYCLFNCPDADDSESYGDPAYPGIRMRVIKQPDDRDIVDLFEFTTDSGNPDFEEHWRETLHGEETLWKIVRVVITDSRIYLQFASEHFRREEARLMSEIVSMEMGDDERNALLDSLPSDTDYMNLDAASLRATLQFEVPHPHSPGVDIVEVGLRERYGITVTEIDGNKKRKFEIHPPIKKEDFNNLHTTVTEYM